MNTISPLIYSAGILATAAVGFSSGYATFLYVSGRRNLLRPDHVAAFAILAPLVWIGSSAAAAIIGAYNGLLPPDPSALAYAAAALLLPSCWLASRTIIDLEAPARGQQTKTSSPPPPQDNNPWRDEW